MEDWQQFAASESRANRLLLPSQSVIGEKSWKALQQTAIGDKKFGEDGAMGSWQRLAASE